MKAHRSPLFVAALASLALAGCSHGGSTGASGDLAIVNGEAIPMDEYYRYLERKPVVQVQVPQPVQQPGVVELRVAQTLGFQALRDLINRRILLDVARDEKVMPSADDVAKELQFQRTLQPDFMQRLTAGGLTLDDIRRDLTIDLAKEKVLTKGITETSADADAFIKAHPDQFMQPEQAKMILVLRNSKADEQQVNADLAAGKPFQTVAEQWSTDPNVRRSQGMMMVNDVSKAPPALQQIIESTPEGKTTDWIPQPEGKFAKLYIEQKIKSKPQTLDANQKEALRRRLALERGGAASDLPQRLVDKLKTSKITVESKSLQPLWDAAYKQLMEAPASAPGATSNPVGTPPPGNGATTPGVGTPPAAGRQ